MSGFLLSGGLGWNSGEWGPACLGIQGVEVVTANGQSIRADEDRNAELFWAARGAGPGFCGVVTRFHLRLYSLPKAITSSTYIYPLDDAEDVSRWAAEARTALPATVALTLLLASAPPELASKPDEKVVILTSTAFVDSWDEASRALAPLDGCPAPDRCLLRQVNEPAPLDALYDREDASWPEGHRYAADNLWSNADLTEVVPRLREHVLRSPSAKSLVLVIMPPIPPQGAQLPETAFSMLGRTLVGYYSVWEDEADDEANIGWLKNAMESLDPLAVGHYVAETDLLAEPSRPARSFSADAWERLTTLRGRLDPQGVFQPYLGME